MMKLQQAAAASSLTQVQRPQTSLPNGPPVAEASSTRSLNISHTKPIMIPSHPLAHSPRTARRKMLPTELTESLRRHLLWECQENCRTVNAVFKCRHTGIHRVRGDTEVTVYGAASWYIAKMSPGQEIATRRHRGLQESTETTDSIEGYDPW